MATSHLTGLLGKGGNRNRNISVVVPRDTTEYMAYPEEAMAIRHCLKPFIDFNDLMGESGFLSAIVNDSIIVGQRGGDKLYMLDGLNHNLKEMMLGQSLSNFRLGALSSDNHGKLYVGCSNSHCIYEGFMF